MSLLRWLNRASEPRAYRRCQPEFIIYIEFPEPSSQSPDTLTTQPHTPTTQPHEGLNTGLNTDLNHDEGLDFNDDEGLDSSDDEGLDSSDDEGLDFNNDEDLDSSDNEGLDFNDDKGLDFSDNKGLDSSNDKGLDSSDNEGLHPSDNEDLAENLAEDLTEDLTEGLTEDLITQFCNEIEREDLDWQLYKSLDVPYPDDQSYQPLFLPKDRASKPEDLPENPDPVKLFQLFFPVMLHYTLQDTPRSSVVPTQGKLWCSYRWANTLTY